MTTNQTPTTTSTIDTTPTPTPVVESFELCICPTKEEVLGVNYFLEVDCEKHGVTKVFGREYLL